MQEKAELIQSQTAVQQRREQQRQEAASEACQRYLVNGHLLAGLCKDADDSELADQEASGQLGSFACQRYYSSGHAAAPQGCHSIR